MKLIYVLKLNYYTLYTNLYTTIVVCNHSKCAKHTYCDVSIFTVNTF